VIKSNQRSAKKVLRENFRGRGAVLCSNYLIQNLYNFCNISKKNFYNRIRRVARNNARVFQKPLETTLEVMYVVIY
jgi:hypothetical protein